MKRFTQLLIVSLVVLASCKGSDDEPIDPYVSFASRVLGTWKVSASINNNTTSSETYPASIQTSTFTFKNDGKMSIKVVCNNGKADRYLVSETGAVIIDGFASTSLACSPIALSNEWDKRIRNVINNANHIKITGSLMTINGLDDYSLTLTKE